MNTSEYNHCLSVIDLTYYIHFTSSGQGFFSGILVASVWFGHNNRKRVNVVPVVLACRREPRIVAAIRELVAAGGKPTDPLPVRKYTTLIRLSNGSLPRLRPGHPVRVASPAPGDST